MNEEIRTNKKLSMLAQQATRMGKVINKTETKIYNMRDNLLESEQKINKKVDRLLMKSPGAKLSKMMSMESQLERN